MTDVSAIADGLARFEARGPCTDAERRAANWLHDELRRAGYEAWVETHWVRPQWALSIALHATLGVVASILAVSVPLAALVLAVVAAAFPLRWLLPRRATQNVLVEPDARWAAKADARGAAAAPDAAEPTPRAPLTLLIAAPYAAPKGGLGAGVLGRLPGGPHAWLAAALLLIAACAGLRQLGFDTVWLGALQFVPTVFLLLGLAAAGDAAVSAYVRGGETAPAVAIALHDALRRDPPERLAPGLLLHGRRREKTDVLVVLEPGDGCASGHPQLRAAAEAAGGTPRRARRRRVPTVWIGADDPDALRFARACIDALDASLR